MSLNTVLSTTLQRLMKERGLKPNSLAKAAGLNPTGIYDILSGKSQHPKANTLLKIAAALSVSPNDLTRAGPQVVPHGFSEEQSPFSAAELVPIVAPNGLLLHQAARILAPKVGHPVVWRVLRTSHETGMQLGDYVVVDPSNLGAADDLVIATYDENLTGDPVTVFRLFAPPYLIGFDDGLPRLLTLDDAGKTVILGKVAAQFRAPDLVSMED